MNSAAESDACGFSLVELTVALVVTLIITGAIYGLLAGGQSAFRREPELSDRQQNIRVAMNLIMKDIGNAGSGLPPFVQTFTRGLDACLSCPNGPAPMGLGGVRTDELEILTNDGSRDNEPVCATPGSGNSGNIRLIRNTLGLSGPVLIIFGDGTWTMMNITDTATDNSGEANCTAGADKMKLNFNSGSGDLSGMNSPSGTCQPNALGVGNAGSPPLGASITNCPGEPVGPGPCCTANEVSFTELVRYRIRNDAAGVPELQRFNTGNFAAGFQTVARGIEDMQVQYTQASGFVTAGTPGAPAVTANVWGSLITQVQVTLSSRSEARNVSGMSNDANLGTRLRGSLTWTGSPRSSLVHLASKGGGTVWR
jgi:type II secretory pathway pseudopilin PulG